MRTFELEGKLRESLGKKDAKKLRVANQVPCVLYGLEENIHFYCNLEAVRKLIYTPHVYLINLNLDGKQYQAVMQDIQYHPVNDEPLHIDFLKTSEDKPVKVNIPVVTNGFAKGIREGGRLQVEMRRLWVSALPKDLPDEIKIDVTNLGINESYRVSDIETDTLKIINVKSVPVVRVMVTRASRSASGAATVDGEEATESEENAEE
ncbi:MAG: 50S ribosomal protein L25/general stress protein Ctc [Prolixibacteraceae bacterium]|jgi:large subunit ribosomal protein L25|nr:50S ribosomal protein L25/general stress protein Ctc [Prolixibacteraceae bacterium]